MLTGKTSHKSPAPYLAAQFQTTILNQQVPPWQGERFALQQIPKDHAIPPQQLTRHPLCQPASGFSMSRLGREVRPEERPPPCAMPRPPCPFLPLGTPAPRVHQRPQAIEPVGRHQPRHHQFPQTRLDFCRKMFGESNEIGKKTGPALGQRVEHVLGDRAERRAWFVRRHREFQQPLGFFTREEIDGRHARRHQRTRRDDGQVAFRQDRRREPAPGYESAQAEPIEQFRFVACDAGRQNPALPRRSCGLEPGQLAQHLQKTGFSM